MYSVTKRGKVLIQRQYSSGRAKLESGNYPRNLERGSRVSSSSPSARRVRNYTTSRKVFARVLIPSDGYRALIRLHAQGVSSSFARKLGREIEWVAVPFSRFTGAFKPPAFTRNSPGDIGPRPINLCHVGNRTRPVSV